jgi:hypothetical protein
MALVNMRFLPLLIVAPALLAIAACDRPCRELADTLCSQPGTDERSCEAWRERTSRVPTQTCESALRTWKRDRTK